jgi:CheY-like chemotaxis protein
MKAAWDNRPEVILLVSTETRTRDLCRRILVAHGYAVLEADNGFEALLLAGEHQGRVDLLLADVALPRMSGARLARAFELLWRRRLPVVYLGGAAAPGKPRPEAEWIPQALLPSMLQSTVDGILHTPRQLPLVH